MGDGLKVTLPPLHLVTRSLQFASSISRRIALGRGSSTAATKNASPSAGISVASSHGHWGGVGGFTCAVSCLTPITREDVGVGDKVGGGAVGVAASMRVAVGGDVSVAGVMPVGVAVGAICVTGIIMVGALVGVLVDVGRAAGAD